MNMMHAGLAAIVLGAGGYFLSSGEFGASSTRPGYERGEYYAKCDRDYLQSAPYLPYSASSSECECFDERLQQLTPSQQSAAYKTLKDRLTLAFMRKAGADVNGTNVSYNDRVLGRVDFKARIATSGSEIIEQCSMF